jgi:hypothetical protein
MPGGVWDVYLVTSKTTTKVVKMDELALAPCKLFLAVRPDIR